MALAIVVEVAERAHAEDSAANGGPALRVDHLTKRFGERVAFQDVSFTVAVGEVFGFLGPNGAAKTTTVRTLGTLIAPTSGSASVAGIPLTSDNGAEIRQRISIMPENPGLYQRLTVIENLQLFAGLYGQRSAGPRIDQALEAVNLTARGRDLCGSLSKGLRQRVGLARALLNDPAVMSSTSQRQGWIRWPHARSTISSSGYVSAGSPFSSPPIVWRKRNASATAWPSLTPRSGWWDGLTSSGRASSADP